MFSKTLALTLGALLVVAGISFVEDISPVPLNYQAALAATTTTSGVTLSTNVQTAITLTLSTGTVALGSLTPGSPNTATTSATIATNNAAGFTFQVNRDTAGQTLLHTDASTAFPDATAWNPSGSGNATTTNVVGANLHFKVASTGTDVAAYNSTYWGPNDTDGASNAKYAGFPVSSQTIASNSSFNSTNQIVVSRYRIDAPATQKSGSYSGGITYTAFANP